MGARIHLMRHGSHADLGRRLTGRGPCAGLTRAGEDEALRTARTLSDRGVERIDTSPRRRCIQTAGIVAQMIGVETAVVGALDEIDFGSWTGCAFPELDGTAPWKLWNERRSAAAAPDGEAMTAAQARIVGHIMTLTRDPGPVVLLVTHQDLIKAAILHCQGRSLDLHASFAIDPASVSTLALDGDRMSVTALNERPI